MEIVNLGKREKIIDVALFYVYNHDEKSLDFFELYDYTNAFSIENVRMVSALRL